jgi:dTMP kinase
LKHRGIFISFEGGEGSGKTTLIDALYAALSKEERNIIKTREPGGSELGASIRSLLLDHKGIAISPRSELFLFLADRAHHVDALILPELKEGKIVLCDRFTDSTIAYQGAARGLAGDQLKELCDFAAASLKPDLTFYLDIDPAIGLKRLSTTRCFPDRIEQENLDFHHLIRASYLQIAKEESERVKVIDATLPVDQVKTQALDSIHALFSSRRQ